MKTGITYYWVVPYRQRYGVWLLSRLVFRLLHSVVLDRFCRAQSHGRLNEIKKRVIISMFCISLWALWKERNVVNCHLYEGSWRKLNVCLFYGFRVGASNLVRGGMNAVCIWCSQKNILLEQCSRMTTMEPMGYFKR